MSVYRSHSESERLFKRSTMATLPLSSTTPSTGRTENCFSSYYSSSISRVMEFGLKNGCNSKLLFSSVNYKPMIMRGSRRCIVIRNVFSESKPKSEEPIIEQGLFIFFNPDYLLSIVSFFELCSYLRKNVFIKVSKFPIPNIYVNWAQVTNV